MAAIQERSGSFRVLFRYQGKQHALTLGKVTRAEADATAANIDYVLMRVRQRLLAVPPGVDIVTFVRHDGDPPTSPNQLPAAGEAPSLGMLRDRYLETHGNGSLEQTTLDGVRLHFKHLVGTLGERYPVRDLTLADLQRHVDRRAKARGTRGRRLSPATIKKEIVTLRTAWNWGSRMGLLGGKFPYVGLCYPKMDEKSSFRTRDEIERRISSGGMGEAELAEAWDSLYLTSSEIDELLEHVRSVAGHGWIYPMFCLAAHTGARRSEMLRMNLHDLDLGGQTIIVHENKRARGRRTTRRVPLSPFLIRVLQVRWTPLARPKNDNSSLLSRQPFSTSVPR